MNRLRHVHTAPTNTRTHIVWPKKNANLSCVTNPVFGEQSQSKESLNALRQMTHSYLCWSGPLERALPAREFTCLEWQRHISSRRTCRPSLHHASLVAYLPINILQTKPVVTACIISIGGLNNKPIQLLSDKPRKAALRFCPHSIQPLISIRWFLKKKKWKRTNVHFYSLDQRHRERNMKTTSSTEGIFFAKWQTFPHHRLVLTTSWAPLQSLLMATRVYRFFKYSGTV